ncbi:MAG: VOC family protein [Pseudomonadota bacterium]
MASSTHLVFDGQCQSAFLFYQQLLRGTITTMVSYGEKGASVAPRWRHLIAEVVLRADEFELTGADILPDQYRQPQESSVTLELQAPADAERIYNALAEGGKITLPFQHTFWSSGFGMLVDRFGVSWEISSAERVVKKK